MPRARNPFTIYPKHRFSKSGKKSTIYYYSLNRECGLPPNICDEEQRKSTGKRTKGAAFEWVLKERIPELQTVAKKQEIGTTLREYLDPFYVPGRCPHMARLAADRRPMSIRWADDQRSRLKRLIFKDPIAGIPIAELSPGDFEDWKQRVIDDFGPRTVNMALSAVKAAFAEGLHRGDIRFDPTQVVSKIKEDSKEQGIYSIAELRRIFIQEPELWNYPKAYNGNENGKITNLMVFAYAFLFATTGERPGALLKLRWQDVGSDEIEFRPEILKTGAARVVPLIPAVTETMGRLRDERNRTADENFVFTYPSGAPVQYSWYRENWERMMVTSKLPECDDSGLKRVPYSFKHSLVTHLVDEGADPVFVREYVGHSHGGGAGGRGLTRVQARYKRRQAEKLKSEILPFVEKIFR